MSDPIRARLDALRYKAGDQAPKAMDLNIQNAALRAVLDLCDSEDRIGWGITETDDIRRVIAEHLGVTDG